MCFGFQFLLRQVSISWARLIRLLGFSQLPQLRYYFAECFLVNISQIKPLKYRFTSRALGYIGGTLVRSKLIESQDRSENAAMERGRFVSISGLMSPSSLHSPPILDHLSKTVTLTFLDRTNFLA